MKGLAAHQPSKPLFDAVFGESELAALDATLAADIVRGPVDPQTFTVAAAPSMQVAPGEVLSPAEGPRTGHERETKRDPLLFAAPVEPTARQFALATAGCSFTPSGREEFARAGLPRRV